MSYPLRKTKSRSRAAENLSARVYQQIKHLIFCNEVMPGQKMRHQELSDRLGVSRIPVREALTRLVQEGFVSLLPNRGFTCKEIRLQEAEELYEMREALEAFAVEKAVEGLNENALEQLSQKMDIYGTDVQRRFSRERLICDQDIHLEIASLSGNEILIRTLTQVFERIILKRRTDGLSDPARGVTTRQEHIDPFQAMKRRDAAAEVLSIRAHSRAGKDNVLSDWRQRQKIRELHGSGIFD
jgi:DNA-binding GntR family transcriptional regulator